MDTKAGQTPVALRPHRANGYGLLRLVLASLVIIQHSLYLTGNEEYIFVGLAELGRKANYGDLAVGGFFALSGFLLQASVIRNRPARFLRFRFFRLLPGFWATLVVVALVLAPAIAWQAGTQSTYRILGSDSASTYVAANAALLITQPSIGGVLGTHPYPEALDGSLWTLLPEFMCYMTLLAISVLGRRLRLTGWWPPAGVAGCALLVFWVAEIAVPGGIGLMLSQMASLAAAFFCGSTLAAIHAQRRATPRNTLVVGAALVAALTMGLWLPVGPPLLALFVVFLGAELHKGWPSRVGTRNDLSYGIYLYHFPVIQLIVATGLLGASVAVAILAVAPLALLVTVPLAAASWHLVEAPAQRFARRRKPSHAVVEPSPA